MCTAATYQTRDFYFGRTLDYEFSYGDEVTITPRGYTFAFRHGCDEQRAGGRDGRVRKAKKGL